MSAESRLKLLDIEFPAPPQAAGLYAPCVQVGNLIVVSGQIPTVDGKPAARGRLGAGIGVEEGAGLARICTLNALAIVRAHLGSLDRVRRVVRVGAFVASAPGFSDQPEVANGASQLLIDLFGEAGRHARAAVGVAELPRGVPVEVEYLFEIEPADNAGAGSQVRQARRKGQAAGKGGGKQSKKQKRR